MTQIQECRCDCTGNAIGEIQRRAIPEYVQPMQAPLHHTDGESTEGSEDDEADEIPVVLGIEHEEVEMDLRECKLFILSYYVFF